MIERPTLSARHRQALTAGRIPYRVFPVKEEQVMDYKTLTVKRLVIKDPSGKSHIELSGIGHGNGPVITIYDEKGGVRWCAIKDGSWIKEIED